MRLIDADALISRGYPTVYHTEFGDAVVNVDDVNNAPTIEVEPVRHGKWIKQEVVTDNKAGIEEWQSAKCSECGKYHTTPYAYYFDHYDYCPNCGARMDEEEKQNA